MTEADRWEKENSRKAAARKAMKRLTASKSRARAIRKCMKKKARDARTN